MQVRAVRSFLRQEVIYSAYCGLEVLHSSKRHRPSLAEGSDGMCPEIVESIRHVDLTFVLIFCSCRTCGLGPAPRGSIPGEEKSGERGPGRNRPDVVRLDLKVYLERSFEYRWPPARIRE